MALFRIRAETFYLHKDSPRPLHIAKVAFLHTDHDPPFPPQYSRHFLVAALVRSHFIGPKRYVSLWRALASRASVPEASVNENDQAHFAEHEVGFTRQPSFVHSPP